MGKAGRELRVQDLHGYLAVVPQVVREEHGAHAVSTDRSLDPVSSGEGRLQPRQEIGHPNGTLLGDISIIRRDHRPGQRESTTRGGPCSRRPATPPPSPAQPPAAPAGPGAVPGAADQAELAQVSRHHLGMRGPAADAGEDAGLLALARPDARRRAGLNVDWRPGNEEWMKACGGDRCRGAETAA
jgi:hypothetical protein